MTSAPWPDNPVVLEVNTWVWLAELGQGPSRPADLASVPAPAWDALALPGVDAVWLMGVWRRSATGRAVARTSPAFVAAHRAALPDLVDDDVVGSPYCVAGYAVDPAIGGDEGLRTARAELAARGCRLVLDFVPNHVAPDHPWAAEHPDWFVRGTDDERMTDPPGAVVVGDAVLACGRDPYFPPWPDVLQLDVFRPGLRAAVAGLLADLTDRCDGLRCDMAMLVLADVFARTWGERVAPDPGGEYWTEVITAVRAARPDFLLMAEAYWGLEDRLLGLGFDRCYDKEMYDRVLAGDARGVRASLSGDPNRQRRTVRFVENHDEPRLAGVLDHARARAALVVVATVPGALLLHEGQLEGRQVRLPVALGRRPEEPVDAEVAAAHARVLAALGAGLRRGTWQVAPTTGWPDNPTHERMVAWTWTTGEGTDGRWLVVVNLAADGSQGRVHLPWPDLAGRTWWLADALDDAVYERDGEELAAEGLYVDLPSWGAHLLRVTPGRPAGVSARP